MTDGRWTSARIRAALLEHRQTVGGGGYPVALRERAVRCARRMRGRGLSVGEIASELGITANTAGVWSEGPKSTKGAGDTLSFVPVVVGNEAPRREGLSRLEVSFPTGTVLRVEAVDGEGISAAIAALSSRGLA